MSCTAQTHLQEKVIVLLSTYNGEKYILPLLESLSKQTYPSVSVYIRDDGSSDHTCEIIENFIALHNQTSPLPVTFHLMQDQKGNLGYPACFHELLSVCPDADYYCLCDQDDVWEPDKIARSAEQLRNGLSSKPLLCFTAYEICDNSLLPKGVSRQVQLPIQLQHVMYDFFIYGFNLMINHTMRIKLIDHKTERIHEQDYWCALIAASCGQIFYIPDSMVKYRRNDGAVTKEDQNAFSLFWWRFKAFILGNRMEVITSSLYDLRQLFGSEMNAHDRQMLDLFNSHTFFSQMKKIFFPHRLRALFSEEIMLRILFMLGKA